MGTFYLNPFKILKMNGLLLSKNKNVDIIEDQVLESKPEWGNLRKDELVMLDIPIKVFPALEVKSHRSICKKFKFKNTTKEKKLLDINSDEPNILEVKTS